MLTQSHDHLGQFISKSHNTRTTNEPVMNMNFKLIHIRTFQTLQLSNVTLTLKQSKCLLLKTSHLDMIMFFANSVQTHIMNYKATSRTRTCIPSFYINGQCKHSKCPFGIFLEANEWSQCTTRRLDTMHNLVNKFKNPIMCKQVMIRKLKDQHKHKQKHTQTHMYTNA